MADATRITGERIGKPDLKSIHFFRQDSISGLVESGLTNDMAQLLAEMRAGINDGLFGTGRKRTPEMVTPTKFEAFADVFARIYRS